MRYILIIAVLISGCAKSQTTGALGKVTYAPKSLIIIAGESNAGGYALNSDPTAYELAPRSSTKILNNTTLLFETLDIGANNLLGHQGLTDNATHGFENGLANSADSNRIPVTSYIMKSGMGGSTIIQWTNPDSLYGAVNGWTQFKPRVDSAIKLMRTVNNGTDAPLYLFWTQGINDSIYNYRTNLVWKDSTKSLFAQMRVRYGHLPIFITYLPSLYAGYNARITEIASEVTECYAIQTSDAAMRDGNHWSYAGLKLIAARMVSLLLAHYTL